MDADGLVGREREAALVASVAASPAGTGGVLLLTGPPGIGKSALLRVARAAAHGAGHLVLQATGVEGEMHLPFSGLHQVLWPLVGALDGLPPARAVALRTALGMSTGAPPDVFLLAEAALSVVVHAQRERPVTLLVDDLHWLDPQSHQIVAFLAHRAGTSGLRVLGAVRSGHPGPFADGGFRALAVPAVDDRAAEVLLSRHAARLTPADRRRIRLDALGNPLALLELPVTWADGPPTDDHPPALSSRLERAFAGRAADLPLAGRDALLVAAVASSSDREEVVAALAELGHRDAAGALSDAAAAGLLDLTAGTVRFRHPLMRSAVLQRDSVARRQQAHAAFGRSLVSDGYRRAWHRSWATVGPDDAVADELGQAAAALSARGAVLSAAAGLERAAHLTTAPGRRGARLLAAAGLAFSAGRGDVVARLLDQAAGVDLDPLDGCRALLLSEALNGDASPDVARVQQLCAAARLAADLGEVGLALDVLLTASMRCWWADSGQGERGLVVDALDQMAHARHDPRHLAALAVAEPVLRGTEVLLLLRADHPERTTDGESLRLQGLAAYGVGDLVLATDLLDRADGVFREQGRLGLLPLVLALQLHIRLDLGDWAGAAAASRAVVDVAAETGQAVFATNNVLVEARGTALRGDWRRALQVMARAEAEALQGRVNDRVCLAYQARGIALLSADRPAEAFACLRRQYDPGDVGYHLRESFGTVALLAEAAVASGRAEHLDQARAVVAGLEAVAVLTASPQLELNLLYARAVLAPADEQDGHLCAALERDLARWPWLRARLHLARGQQLASSGRPDEAAEQLSTARDLFGVLGARRWTRTAERALSVGAAARAAGRDEAAGTGR